MLGIIILSYFLAYPKYNLGDVEKPWLEVVDGPVTQTFRFLAIRIYDVSEIEKAMIQGVPWH